MLTPIKTLELLVDSLNTEQLLTIIQSYLDDRIIIIDSLDLNTQFLKILNEKLKEYA